MAREFVSENERAKEKLAVLAKNLTEEDFGKVDPGGWTIGVVFAHIAFWDQRTIKLLERWEKNGVSPSPIDTDLVNESLTILFKTVPPREAVAIALVTADILCRKIERLSDELVRAIEELGDRMRIHRYLHWRMHIDQVERMMKSYPA